MSVSHHFTRWTVVALASIASTVALADEARFDVAVVDAPARQFFEGLGDGTPYNIVLEPGISGTVTLKLRGVTVPEALDAVREAYGYDYRKMPSGYVIVPPNLQTRMFQINYLDLERRGTSRTRITSGSVSDQGRSSQQNGGNAGTGVNGGGGMAMSGSSALSEPPGGVFGRSADGRSNGQVADIIGSSISTRSASDFWAGLESSLKTLVSADGGRAIVVNAQSGVVVVRAMPRELRDIAQFLAQIESVSTREVVLEAKILEVELSDGFQAGINWAAIGRQGSKTFSGFQTGPQNGFGSTNLFNQPSNAVPLSPGIPITSSLTNTLGGAFALAVNTADFSASGV